MKRILSFVSLALLAFSQLPAHAAAPAADMAGAASRFLDALQPAQRAKAVYELKSEARHQWHFIPTEMVSFGRKGVPFTELTPAQRELGLALLRTAMSDPGYKKATDIISLESVLKAIEKGGRVDRNPELYFVSIYGQPDAKGTWAWRFEGHHLSLNFTVVDGRLFSSTPSFMGSNPAEVRDGPHKGLRVLGKEEDLARSLVKSLDDAQRASAVFTDAAPNDIVTSANRTASPLKPEGVAWGKLNADQQKLLRQLINEYVGRVRPELAKTDLAKIGKAGWDKVHFGWAGSLDKGQGHYYRVQGPTFLLEYANTQNDANHVHATWREFKGDFGEDLLKKHFEQEHK